MFQAAIWPDVTDEGGNRDAVKVRGEVKASVRTYDRFPIRAFDRWLDESRPHLWVVEFEAGRTSRPLFAGSALARATGFGAQPLQATWTPDGAAVVFAATDQQDQSARAVVTTSLWQVPDVGGEPQRLEAAGLDVSSPRFRPDGRALCMTARDATPSIYHVPFVACGTWPWAAVNTHHGRDLDRSIGSWSFAPDSATLFFTAEDAGHE